MAAGRKTSIAHAGEGRLCGECAESYDPHSPDIDGHMILGRCRHRKENGKYSIFIKDKACELFKPKK